VGIICVVMVGTWVMASVQDNSIRSDTTMEMDALESRFCKETRVPQLPDCSLSKQSHPISVDGSKSSSSGQSSMAEVSFESLDSVDMPTTHSAMQLPTKPSILQHSLSNCSLGFSMSIGLECWRESIGLDIVGVLHMHNLIIMIRFCTLQ
jgi:hypothetical protein